MNFSRGVQIPKSDPATPASAESLARLRPSPLSTSASDDPPEFHASHPVVAASGTKDGPPIRKSQRIASRLSKAKQVDSRDGAAVDRECNGFTGQLLYRSLIFTLTWGQVRTLP